MTVAPILICILWLTCCKTSDCSNFSLSVSTSLVMPRGSSGSKLHPEKECGPCKLCKRNESRYWHIGQAVDPQYDQLRTTLRELGIEDSDCICQACQRNPKQEKPPSSEKRKTDEACAVDGRENVNTKKIKTNVDNFPSYVLDVFDVRERTYSLFLIV